jgi:predicted MFS family arabinose efflux permease
MSKKAACRPWLVWWIAAAFYLYELVLRVSPSVMTDGLMSSFNATSTLIGILISFYYYSYTVLQLPCGIIIDKLGAKNLLLSSSVLCIAGSCLFASTENINIAQLGRFLIGAGSACAFISCLQIATNLFASKYFVILVGVTNVMGTFGGLLGGFPVAKLVNSFGWRTTTYVLAGIGIVIVVLIVLFIPKNIRNASDNRNSSSIPILKTVLNLISNYQVVLSGIVSGLMYLPISSFAELWVVPFFMSKYGVNNETASTAAAAIFVGVAVGSLVIAMLVRRLGGYMKSLRIFAILTVALFVFLVFKSDDFTTSIIVVFLIGVMTGAQPICFTCSKNYVPAHMAGSALAMTNCLIMAIGAIFQPMLGALLDSFWGGEFAENGVRIYDASCYKFAILTIPVAIFASVFISLFMKETIDTENE